MGDKYLNEELTIFTIGHSNHLLEKLLELLKQHQIEVVVDVRSSPYSQYASHFNKEAFQRSLRAQAIDYLFLGDIIGGRPEGQEFYDEKGYVLYDRLAQSPKFQQRITRLLEVIQSYRAVLFCSEEDPTNCHRRLLIGRVLCERGVRVLHIRGDERIQSEAEIAKEEEFRKTMGQMSLFDEEETEEWKSTQSVSPKKVQEHSSRVSKEPGSSA